MKLLKLSVVLIIFCLAPTITIKASWNSTCKVFVDVNVPFLPSRGITLYPAVIYINTVYIKTSDVVRHENVHCAQVSKEGWLPFYAGYLYSYAKNRYVGMSHEMAYWAIPFEIEARQGEEDQ